MPEATRYDDATARAYRTLEATAQWILKQKHGVDTGRSRDRHQTQARIRTRYGGPMGILPEKIASPRRGGSLR
jgi:hypothetical protein